MRKIFIKYYEFLDLEQMTMKRLIIGSVILALPVASQAADLYSPPSTYESGDYGAVSSGDFNWTSFYLGGHLGWAWDDAEYTLDNTGFWGTAGDQATIDSNGLIGGGQFGFWYQQGNDNVVYGADVSGSWADLGGSVASPNSDTWSAETDWYLLAQVRLGFAAGRWLLFGQGGYAGGKGTASATDGIVSASDSQWHNGWTAGGGLSYKVTPAVSLGTEYNYVDLGSKTYSLMGDSVTVDHQSHVVKGTINFHFGGN